MSEKMLRFLGQITDGRSAWAEFYGGVTAAFEANESAVPVIGVVLLVLVVTLINVRLAVWLGKRWGSPRGGRRVRR
ncbi:MAG: hypothetical protein AAFR76_09840 [Planctomycetota bacterium]